MSADTDRLNIKLNPFESAEICLNEFLRSKKRRINA